MDTIEGQIGDLKIKVWLTGSIDVETKEQFIQMNTYVEHTDGRNDHGWFTLNLKKPITSFDLKNETA